MTKKEADKLGKLLIDAIRNLDPKEAIDNTDPRYIDCMSVRGEEGAVVKHIDTIILNACKAGSKPKTYLFSGHNGSGKSTELKSIQKALMDKKLFTIKIDANEMLNLEDPNYIDILFSITSGIERHMDNAKMPLPKQTVAEIEKWSSETIYENATDSGKSMDLGAGLKMDSSIPFLGGLMEGHGMMFILHAENPKIQRCFGPVAKIRIYPFMIKFFFNEWIPILLRTWNE